MTSGTNGIALWVDTAKGAPIATARRSATIDCDGRLALRLERINESRIDNRKRVQTKKAWGDIGKIHDKLRPVRCVTHPYLGLSIRDKMEILTRRYSMNKRSDHDGQAYDNYCPPGRRRIIIVLRRGVDTGKMPIKIRCGYTFSF